MESSTKSDLSKKRIRDAEEAVHRGADDWCVEAGAGRCSRMLAALAVRCAGRTRGAKTVVLKLKKKEINSLTRSFTPPAPPSSCDELTTIALALRERVALGPKQLFRLVGVGLSNFQLDTASPLFFEDEDGAASAELSI
jgi:DNA polymerase-4